MRMPSRVVEGWQAACERKLRELEKSEQTRMGDVRAKE